MDQNISYKKYLGRCNFPVTSQKFNARSHLFCPIVRGYRVYYCQGSSSAFCGAIMCYQIMAPRATSNWSVFSILGVAMLNAWVYSVKCDRSFRATVLSKWNKYLYGESSKVEHTARLLRLLLGIIAESSNANIDRSKDIGYQRTLLYRKTARIAHNDLSRFRRWLIALLCAIYP